MQIDSSLYEDFLFSCVVDSDFKFQSQVHSWATSLIDLAGVPGRAIVVHTVASLDPALESWFARRGSRDSRDCAVPWSRLLQQACPTGFSQHLQQTIRGDDGLRHRGHGSNQLAQAAGDLRQACGYRTTATNHSDPPLFWAHVWGAAL